MKNLPTIRLLLAAGGLAFAAAVQAQPAYPNQPIKMIVPAPPGGGTDLMARIVSHAITTNTGWTVIIDNKPGASGLIGTDAAAKAKPDGYTLLMGQTATLAANSELFSKMPYEPLKDFVPIAMVAAQPVVVVVRADSPYKNLADLVAAMKAKPLSMGSAGAGTAGQLVGEFFARTVGGKVNTIPYKGSAPALQDVVGGQTDFMFATPPGALPLLEGGRLRALGVSSTKRLPMLPNVPTIAESGHRGFEASEWKVLVAPAGTPPAIVQRLHAEVQKALGQPATLSKILADGNLPLPGTQPQAAAFLKTEFIRWTSLVRDSGASKTN